VAAETRHQFGHELGRKTDCSWGEEDASALVAVGVVMPGITTQGRGARLPQARLCREGHACTGKGLLQGIMFGCGVN
jgi:hypothetical protein